MTPVVCHHIRPVLKRCTGVQNAPPEAQPTEQPAEEGPESEEVRWYLGIGDGCWRPACASPSDCLPPMQEDHEDIENELGIEITKDADEEEEERSEAGGGNNHALLWCRRGQLSSQRWGVGAQITVAAQMEMQQSPLPLRASQHQRPCPDLFWSLSRQSGSCPKR